MPCPFSVCFCIEGLCPLPLAVPKIHYGLVAYEF